MNNDIDKIMAFVAAVSDVRKEIDKEYTLYPICDGQFKTIKNCYNSHCTGSCTTYGTRMME